MKVIGALIAASAFGGDARSETPRVMSLDQCADQYVLTLAPGFDLALSPRADDPDAALRRKAMGRLRLRPTLENVVGFRPDVVIRTWGGDARLLRRLEADGVDVLTLEDAKTFKDVRANVRAAAHMLHREGSGERVIAEMDARLAAIPRAAQHSSGYYMTAGGFTAGAGTMVDAVLRAAGLRNAADRPGFNPVNLERLALDPPARFVLGFFDQVRADWRGAGRHPVARRLAHGRTVARLPSSVLSCPAWTSADAAFQISKGA